MELSEDMKQQYDLLATLVLSDQIPQERVPMFVAQYPGLGEYILSRRNDRGGGLSARQRLGNTGF